MTSFSSCLHKRLLPASRALCCHVCSVLPCPNRAQSYLLVPYPALPRPRTALPWPPDPALPVPALPTLSPAPPCQATSPPALTLVPALHSCQIVALTFLAVHCPPLLHALAPSMPPPFTHQFSLSCVVDCVAKFNGCQSPLCSNIMGRENHRQQTAAERYKRITGQHQQFHNTLRTF